MSGYNNVTIIGHSLGAALALLDSVYLPVFIPDAYYTLITYGLPRVGNSYFAAYVDRNVNLTRITNKYVLTSSRKRGGVTTYFFSFSERTQCLSFLESRKDSPILKENDISISTGRGSSVPGRITQIRGVLELRSLTSSLAMYPTTTVLFQIF